MSPVAPRRQGRRRGVAPTRPLRCAAVLVAVSVLAGFSVVGCGGSQRPAAKQQQHVSSRSKAAKAAGRAVRESIVATARTPRVAVYRSAGSSTPFLRLANPTDSGAPLVFLVRRRVAGRDQVYLPVRPNESKGWVNERDVVLASNPYSLQVRLHAHQLLLPTPTGLYYIVELLRQPNPEGPYGPYAFGLSAHSNVLYSFGGGPGQIGIHGTDVASSIGRSASHGCIRISNAAITRLATELPLGTPVRIGE